MHSPSQDPPVDDPSTWPGEAKLAGHAMETGDASSVGTPHRFRLDIREVVFTHIADGELEVQFWHEGRGIEVRRRA